jgi:hypothetical protein
MTEPNFRALCAGLASYLQARKDLECGWWPGEDPEQELLDRARAALAQPEPQGPSDEAIMQLACISLGYEYTPSLLSSPENGIGALEALPSELLAFARAVLALAQPEPQGAISEAELEDGWNQQADQFNQWDSLSLGEQLAWAQARALARFSRPAIKPVPVSERLPGPEDCFSDQHGQRSYKCWAQQYHQDNNGQPLRTVLEAWDLVDYRLLARCRRWYYAWLPYYALPVPQQEVK